VSVTTVMRAEQGRSVQLASAVGLASAYGVTVGALLDGRTVVIPFKVTCARCGTVYDRDEHGILTHPESNCQAAVTGEHIIEVIPCADAPYTCHGFDPADWAPGCVPDFTLVREWERGGQA
jgi:hypothetical protein